MGAQNGIIAGKVRGSKAWGEAGGRNWGTQVWPLAAGARREQLRIRGQALQRTQVQPD